MMTLKKIALGVAAASFVAAPVVAQSAFAPTVASLTGEENGLEGGSAIIVGVVAAAAVIGGIIILSDDNDADLPVSG